MFDFIKENIINKPLAAWTLPSKVTTTNHDVFNGLAAQDKYLFGYKEIKINKVDKPNDKDGKLDVVIEIIKTDNSKEVKTITFGGFLTEKEDKDIKSDDLKEFVAGLKTTFDYEVKTLLNDDLKKLSLNDANKKKISELINIDALKAVTGADAADKPFANIASFSEIEEVSSRIDKILGVEYPFIVKEIRYVKNGKKTAPITLFIGQFDKDITINEVKNMIFAQEFNNFTEMAKIKATEVAKQTDIANVQKYFNQKISDLEKGFFKNSDNVTVKVTKVSNPNDKNGSLDVEFDITWKSSATGATDQKATHKAKIYGFQVETATK